MKTAIWKFPLQFLSVTQWIEMPKGATVLSVQGQFDQPMMWAEVDPKAPKELRAFKIVGTGHEINPAPNTSKKYISTFQTDGGNYVFHAFEIVIHGQPFTRNH